MPSSSSSPFLIDQHRQYFAAALHSIPEPYCKLDSNRLTLTHFAVHALDLLLVWEDEDLISRYKLDRARIIRWIYSLYLPTTGGFQGGPYAPMPNSENEDYRQGHIAMAYTALCTLVTLGDDLSNLDSKRITGHLRRLQRPDGSFQCTASPSENDMRFLYCACAISHMLDDWSGIDIDLAVKYIQSCKSYDGAIALIPDQEGHGGSTFCGTAALKLMDRLSILDDGESSLSWRNELIYWCVHRQVGGMQGRPNKDEDTCYSYWIGGTLHLLGKDELLDKEALQRFIMECQFDLGGFSKMIGAFPDLLHSFYSLAWLSISKWSSTSTPPGNRDDEGELSPRSLSINQLNCTLGIRQERADLFPLK